MVLPRDLAQRLNEATSIQILVDNARSPVYSVTERRLRRYSSPNTGGISRQSFNRWETDVAGLSCKSIDEETVSSPPSLHAFMALAREHRPVATATATKKSNTSSTHYSSSKSTGSLDSATTGPNGAREGLKQPVRRVSAEDFKKARDNHTPPRSRPKDRKTWECLNSALSISIPENSRLSVPTTTPTATTNTSATMGLRQPTRRQSEETFQKMARPSSQSSSSGQQNETWDTMEVPAAGSPKQRSSNNNTNMMWKSKPFSVSSAMRASLMSRPGTASTSEYLNQALTIAGQSDHSSV